MRTLAVVLVACSAALGQPRGYACAPSPEATAAFREVADLERTLPGDLWTGKARQILAGVVRKRPDDVFAQLRYLHFFNEKGHPDVIGRYRLAMAAHPHDRRYALYYAASLIGTNTPEALRRLTALAAAPDFPYPHLLIGEIHSYQMFEDHAQLTAHLAAFVKACPGYLPAYELLSYAGVGEQLKEVTETLGHVLRGRLDRDVLPAYRWLWPLLFRVTDPREHDALRVRVAQQLVWLRTAYRLFDPIAAETFRAGYRLTGNRIFEIIPAADPPYGRVYKVEEQWTKDHPWKDDAAYHRERARAAEGWMSAFPDEPMPYLRRFQEIAMVPETTEQALIAAGADLIAVHRRRPHEFLSTPAVVYVAREYVKRGVRLNEVPAMLAAGLREVETSRDVPECDFLDDGNYRTNEEYRYRARIETRDVEFDWALKMSQLPRAHKALAAIRADIDSMVAVARQLAFAQYFDGEYWTNMARLADLEGRKEDAARYRQTAEERRNAPARFGGASDRQTVSATGKVLSDFRAASLDGRLWTFADLDGKVVVMNVWATWCAPCVEELPHFQKLYDRLKDRADVVVLSLNVDYNPGLVGQFVKSRSFTFPTLLAHDYVDRMLPDLGIPRTWVVKSGTIRSEQIGFSEPDRWLQEMLATVEEGQRRE